MIITMMFRRSAILFRIVGEAKVEVCRFWQVPLRLQLRVCEA